MFAKVVLVVLMIAPVAASLASPVPQTWAGDGVLEWRFSDTWGDWDEAVPREGGGCEGPFHVAFTQGVDGAWRLEEMTGEATCPGGTPTLGMEIQGEPFYGAEEFLPVPIGTNSGIIIWGDPETGFATGDAYRPFGAVEAGPLGPATPFMLVQLNDFFGVWEILVGEVAMAPCAVPGTTPCSLPVPA